MQGNAVQSVTLWRARAKWDGASQFSGSAALLPLTRPSSKVCITAAASCRLPKEVLG